MKKAETVTFGGSGLDRAAELRLTCNDLKAQSKVVILWRGKPLFDAEGLVRVTADHPALAMVGEDWIFLGRDGEVPIFAANLDLWEPNDLDEDALSSFADPSIQRHPDFAPDAGFEELRVIMTQLSARDAELAITARAMFAWHGSNGFCAACGAQSQMSMGGWQRDCAACSAKHFPRTDPVVIMLITRGNSVLMGRSPAWPAGMYSLLAGFIEPGETIEAAVRREVFEEAGIKVGKVGYLASQPWPFPSSLMLGCHGEALTTDITIDPVEIEDAVWVTREEMADVFAGQHPTILPPRSGPIAGFILENWLADTLG